MGKLCPKGKAAAKRKFKVYPSAYANMYASAVCSGKVTPGGKKNRKKKAEGGLLNEPKRPRGPMDKPVMTRDGIKYSDRSNKPTQKLKRPIKRKKMREGGMVIEDMTTMIEV